MCGWALLLLDSNVPSRVVAGHTAGEASIKKRKQDMPKYLQDCADGGEASIKKRKQDMPKYLQDCADGGREGGRKGGEASIKKRKQDMPKYLQDCADGGRKGGHATALRGGVKGNDGRHMDNATGRSNAARPRERHWKDNAVHLPARRVWADCSTEKCKEGMWLEHFDARDHSVAVAFVHNLDGKKGDEKRCRGPPVGGKRASQGVFRPQTGKSITSGALCRRVSKKK